MRLLTRVCAAGIAGVAAAAGGCGSDETYTPPPTSLVVLDDAATVMPGTDLPADLCARTPLADHVGLTCQDPDFCGGGGLCLTSIGANTTTCAQVCFPTPDPSAPYPEGFPTAFAGCEGACPTGQVCATVLDTTGAPLLLDLNVDGQQDVVAGACQGSPAGSQPHYAACGPAGVCTSDAVCLETEGRPSGTCFPMCSDRCEAADGLRARCSFTTAGASVCLIACDPADAATCPAGMACVESASGGFTCVR